MKSFFSYLIISLAFGSLFSSFAFAQQEENSLIINTAHWFAEMNRSLTLSDFQRTLAPLEINTETVDTRGQKVLSPHSVHISLEGSRFTKVKGPEMYKLVYVYANCNSWYGVHSPRYTEELDFPSLTEAHDYYVKQSYNLNKGVTYHRVGWNTVDTYSSVDCISYLGPESVTKFQPPAKVGYYNLAVTNLIDLEVSCYKKQAQILAQVLQGSLERQKFLVEEGVDTLLFSMVNYSAIRSIRSQDGLKPYRVGASISDDKVLKIEFGIKPGSKACHLIEMKTLASQLDAKIQERKLIQLKHF